MRAPVAIGALSLWADVIAAFGLLDLLRRSRRQSECLRNIFVPAIHIRPELDSRAVPKSGLVEQPHGDFPGKLDEAFVVLLHCLLELVRYPLQLREGGRELHGILHPDAAVARSEER